LEEEKCRYGYKNTDLCAEEYAELVQNGVPEEEAIPEYKWGR